MKNAPSATELRRVIGVVEAKLQAIPEFRGGDEASWKAHRDGVNAALGELARDERAKINSRWDGCSIIIAGVRTNCTSGGAGAMRNWISAAQRWIEQGKAA